MTLKEQQRVMVLNRAEGGEITGKEAGRLMGVSVRQVRRLLGRYRKEGVTAVAHGNRGREPVHKLSDELVSEVAPKALTSFVQNDIGCQQRP